MMICGFPHLWWYGSLPVASRVIFVILIYGLICICDCIGWHLILTYIWGSGKYNVGWIIASTYAFSNWKKQNACTLLRGQISLYNLDLGQFHHSLYPWIGLNSATCEARVSTGQASLFWHISGHFSNWTLTTAPFLVELIFELVYDFIRVFLE